MADTNKTLERFYQLHGVDKKQRRYRPKTLAENNEKAYVAPLDRAVPNGIETVPEVIRPVVQAMQDFNTGTQQLNANLGSGIAQIPGDVAGMADMIRVGAPALVTAIPDRGDGSDYFKRLGDDFMSGIFNDQSKENLAANIREAVKKNFEGKAATAEDIAAFLDTYQDSQEYFDYMTSQMSPGFQIAQYSNDWANKIMNLGKRPDQQTIVDDIEQAFGQSIVGLPKSVMKQLGSNARRVVGDAVFDSVAGKLVTKAGELATPMTLPLTPGNAAANAAVGTGITELVRDATNQPSFLNGAIADLDPPDGHGPMLGEQSDNTMLAAGVTLGSFLGFPAMRRAVTEEAADAAIKGLTAGPTLAEQSTRLKPILSPTTGMVDQNAPIKKGANLFDADNDVLDQLDAWQSGASQSNKVEAEINAVNHGILDGAPPTIPIVEIQRAARALTPEDYELLNQYAPAKHRSHSLAASTKTIEQELRNARLDLGAARARGDARDVTSSQKRLDAAQAKLDELNADNLDSRPSMQEWSDADIRDIISRAEGSQTLGPILKGIEKIHTDITSYLVHNGLLTKEEGLRRLTDQPFFIPMRERSHPNVENSAARGALLLKDRVFGKKSQPGYDESFISAGKREGAINRPKDALTALQEGVMEAVREVTSNNARKKIIEKLESLPGAKGNMLKAVEFEVGNGKSEWVSDGFFEQSGRKQLKRPRGDYVRYRKDGKSRFVEFSDKSMSDALQFAPLAAVPIMNATRKLWQQFTTGFAAPWFATKSALWDIPLAKTTSREGRSLGLLDTYARMAFKESALVNKALDYGHIPGVSMVDAAASATLAIPYQISMRAARAIGEKVSSDLQNNSGVFHAIAQFPGGKEYVDWIGTNMAKTFDRSVMNVFTRRLSTSLSHLAEASKISDDYVVRGRGSTLGRSFRSVINGYKAAIESIQNSTRMAFYVENYMRLKAKHGGTIPEGELLKLDQETRNLTGDMSRVSNSKFIQRLTSVVPYGNTVLQGTRHILGATIPAPVAKGINKMTGGKANMLENRTSKFWPQMISGVILPSIGALTVLEGWEGAEDWWYNKVPEWERGTVIPFPTYEAIEYRFENGEWPEFDPKYMHKLPIAPELGMVAAPVMAGLRSMGVVGPAKSTVPSNFFTQIGSALEQVTNFATPPLAQAFAAINGGRLDLHAGMMGQGFFQETDPTTFGGVNADMRTPNSTISKTVYDVIGALTSGTGQMIAQTFDVFNISQKEKDDFLRSSQKALETFGYEVSRKFPNVPGLPGMERNYAFTPESNYVYDTERTLEPLIGNGRQRTVELDSKDRIERLKEMGMVPPEQISEPLLKAMQEDVYAYLRKKGPFKAADEQYTELRVQLNALEASRAKWPEEAYHEKYNDLVSDQQKLKSIQARLLTKLETDMVGKYGQVFKGVTGTDLTFKTLVEAVRQNVSQ